MPVLTAAYLVSKGSYFDFFSTSDSASVLQLGRLPTKDIVYVTGSPSSEIKVGSTPGQMGGGGRDVGGMGTSADMPRAYSERGSDMQQCAQFGFSGGQSTGINFASAMHFEGGRTVVNAWIDSDDETPVVRGADILTVKMGCFPSVPIGIGVKGGAVEVVEATGITLHAALPTPFSASTSVSSLLEMHPVGQQP